MSRWSWRTSVVELGVLFTVVTIVLAWIGCLSDLRVPFLFADDELFYLSNIRTLLDTGWIQTTPRLGAPFGQQLYDFPLGGEFGNFALIKAITWFTGDVGLVLNLFYLLGFYLTAVSAWFVARAAGCGGAIAVTLALVYDFSFFHFARLVHVMLANYWVLPIAVLVGLAAAGSMLIARRAWWKHALIVLACVCVGCFGAYWAVLGAMTIAMMCALSALGHRSIRPLLHGAAACAVVALTLTASTMGSLLFAARHGDNPAAAFRSQVDVDTYALRLTDLFIPVAETRLRLTEPLTAAMLPLASKEPTQYVGIVGAALLVAMLACGLVAMSAGRRGDRQRSAATYLPAVTVAWLLIAMAGGFAHFLWLAGAHNVRAWNRVSILLLFLVLLWAGLAAQAWFGRAERPPWAKGAGVAALAAVLVVALLDQVPVGFLGDRASAARAYDTDTATFRTLESRLPRGAAVLQLPALRFPGGDRADRMQGYDELVPHILTRRLRFSYGGMLGRESEWQQGLSGMTGRDLIRAAVASGFSAILIDRNGYADNAAALETGLRSTLNARPIVGQNPRWAAFDLTRWKAGHPASKAERERLLGSPRLAQGDCFVWNGKLSEPMTCPGDGFFVLVTAEPHGAVRVPVTFDPGGVAGTLRIRSGGTWRAVRLVGKPITVPVVAGHDRFVRVDYVVEPAAPAWPASANYAPLTVRIPATTRP